MAEMDANHIAIMEFTDGSRLNVPCGEFWVSLSSMLQVMVRLQPNTDDERMKLMDESISSATFDASHAQQVAKIAANNSDAKLPTLILEIGDEETRIQPFKLETTTTQVIFRVQ